MAFVREKGLESWQTPVSLWLYIWWAVWGSADGMATPSLTISPHESPELL